MRRGLFLAVALASLVMLGTGLGVASTQQGVPEDASQLAGIQAVEQATYTYAYQLDSGTIDGLMAVFTDDAVAEYSFYGGNFVLVGKQQIRNFLGGFAGTGGQHMLTDPLVTVNRSTAKGTFYLWRVQPAGTNCPTSNNVGWLMGRYDNEYVKTDGRWQIKHLVFMTQSQGTITGCHFIP